MGYLRLLLSAIVVYGHIVGLPIYNGRIDFRQPIFWMHTNAVFGFYVLSGFLITKITNETYANTLSGKIRFAANRVLRIYPVYWLCLAIGTLLIVLTDHKAHFFYSSLIISNNMGDWIREFFILDINNFKPPPHGKVSILPSAWSLCTELYYYAIIGFITGCYKRLTLILFILSAAITFYYWQLGTSFFKMYLPIQSPAAVFFLGSLLYHYRKCFENMLSGKFYSCIFMAFIITVLPDILGLYKTYDHTSKLLYMYGLSFFYCYIILSLYDSGTKKKASIIENFCADIAFPIFLIHWAVAGFLWVQFPTLQSAKILHFCFTLAGSILASCFVYVLVERPLKKWRALLRNYN